VIQYMGERCATAYLIETSCAIILAYLQGISNH